MEAASVVTKDEPYAPIGTGSTQSNVESSTSLPVPLGGVCSTSRSSSNSSSSSSRNSQESSNESSCADAKTTVTTTSDEKNEEKPSPSIRYLPSSKKEDAALTFPEKYVGV
jgi:hypothetical protein